jgi:hypothetical protein
VLVIHDFPMHAGVPPLRRCKVLCAWIMASRFYTGWPAALVLHMRDGTHPAFCGITASLTTLRRVFLAVEGADRRAPYLVQAGRPHVLRGAFSARP